jgi:hypothetical protein
MRCALLLLTVALAGCATNRTTSKAPPPTPEAGGRSLAPTGLVPPSSMHMDDPIEALVERLSLTHGLWVNGFAPKIDLPANAPTNQVLEQMFKVIGFNNGHVTSYQIVETRQVRIIGGFQDTNFMAVLVETNLGRKVVLLQHQTGPGGWWSRTYDT